MYFKPRFKSFFSNTVANFTLYSVHILHFKPESPFRFCIIYTNIYIYCNLVFFKKEFISKLVISIYFIFQNFPSFQ